MIKSVVYYCLPDGRVPFLAWYDALRDKRAKQRIEARIIRLRLGNLGHTRSVGAGVSELKIYYGPGYRVYFGQDGEDLVILLCGGDKGTQDEDIEKAKEYWQNYKRYKEYADS